MEYGVVGHISTVVCVKDSSGKSNKCLCGILIRDRVRCCVVLCSVLYLKLPYASYLCVRFGVSGSVCGLFFSCPCCLPLLPLLCEPDCCHGTRQLSWCSWNRAHQDKENVFKVLCCDKVSQMYVCFFL